MSIIDVATDVTRHLPALVQAGVKAIIRYDCRPDPGAWKRVSAAEAKAIGAAGLMLGIVNEGQGDHIGAFNNTTGILDARYSRQQAAARGQPDGSAIYFAVDFDPSGGEVEGSILPYFRGVAQAFAEANTLPKLRVGVYGSGMVCRRLKEAGLVEFTWITCSSGFAESRAYVQAEKQDLWQNQCERMLCGLDVDFNIARVAEWGQFVPWGAAPPNSAPPPPAPKPPISPTAPAATSYPFSSKGSWYSQFHGKYTWTDTGDAPNSNALGVLDSAQGISFYDHTTLGHWFEVQAPNGTVSVEQQTDIGPAIWTGRKIDISAAAAERFGYSPSNFPTDQGLFRWRPIPAPASVASLTPRQQALEFLRLGRK